MTTMRTLARIALILAAMLAGAAHAARGAVVLDANADLALEPGEGHLVIAFDLLDEISALRFTGAGEWLTAFSLPRVPVGMSAVALRMPTGNYCLDDFRVGKVKYERKADPTGMCFRVFDGALTYTGHLTARAGRDKRSGVIDWRFLPNAYLSWLQREQPQLLAMHDALRFGPVEDAHEVYQVSNYEYAIAAFELGDVALGQRLLEAGAAKGSTDAMLELGLRYYEGNGLDQDRRQAEAWFARAATAGEVRGAVNNCLMLQQEFSEDARLAEAAKYCEAAAQSGNVQAMALLAPLLAKGAPGLKPDPVGAYTWAAAAAAKGNALGMHHAGVALRDGVGTKADLAAAIAWFEQAVAKGQPQAAYALGELVEQGRGLTADPVRAAQLYQIAADGRVTEGLIAMGRAYAAGRGVPSDPSRGRDLLRDASRRSMDGAMAYAWFLATCPDNALRDAMQARKIALDVIYSREPKLDSDYAVLAAAMANAEDFIGAKKYAQRAIDGRAKRAPATDPQLLAWRAQLAAYQRGQPWREP